MRRMLIWAGLMALTMAAAGAEPPLPAGTPGAVIDLATEEGAGLAKAAWRYADVKIVETEFRAPGSDGQPSTTPARTYDFEPRAGAADFDDSGWQTIAPAALQQRRGTGRLSFGWYRVTVTVPERVNGFATAGSTAVFETSLDDYAEIWVNGELPRRLGQAGGSVIAGWNAPNRLVIARHVKPGQRIQLAIFGANGPLSDPPTNYLWIRYARVAFYPESATGPYAIAPTEVNVRVVRNDPQVDEIVPANFKVFKLAENFAFTEGPVWVAEGKYLLFSDPNSNTIYQYSSAGELSVFRTPSGYEGADIGEYGQPGSNGLALDPQGRLTIDQHGNRRVIRVEGGRDVVLADRYQGQRLNSPNDLVYRSDGALFFTDPPFGLPKFHQDPRKETPFEGVYSLYRGKLRLLTRELTGPNGIAFSPDEKYLYVGNWDEKRKVVMRYEVRPDASVANGKVFFDMTAAAGEDAIDGIKVDERGNVYVSGPGGLWILSPEGRHLGTIVTPMHVHNMAWGDDDRKTLYLASRSELYRVRLNVRGAGVPR